MQNKSTHQSAFPFKFAIHSVALSVTHEKKHRRKQNRSGYSLLSSRVEITMHQVPWDQAQTIIIRRVPTLQEFRDISMATGGTRIFLN